jgi:hypothetical protein
MIYKETPWMYCNPTYAKSYGSRFLLYQRVLSVLAKAGHALPKAISLLGTSLLSGAGKLNIFLAAHYIPVQSGLIL